MNPFPDRAHAAAAQQAGKPILSGNQLLRQVDVSDGHDAPGALKKPGWAYLWVQYEDYDDTAAKSPGKRPVGAYVERVYDDDAFAALQIGVA